MEPSREKLPHQKSMRKVAPAPRTLVHGDMRKIHRWIPRNLGPTPAKAHGKVPPKARPRAPAKSPSNAPAEAPEKART